MTQQGYEKRISRVLDYIHSNPAGDLSLDALADVAAMSRFHWHRIFRGLTGETVAEAVRRIRMQRAATWLVQTNRPLKDVARDSGYATTNSFARTFQQCYGLTPSAFRKSGALTAPLSATLKGNHRMFDVQITNNPERRVLGVPHRGPYTDIARSFAKLGEIVGANDLMGDARGMVGVYYDDPSAVAADALRSHAGLIFDDQIALPKGLEEVRLPAGKTAMLRFTGPYSGLPAAYDYLYGVWLPASGLEAANAPAFEVYLNTPMDTSPEDLITELHLPVALS